jgi:hypothetical protein
MWPILDIFSTDPIPFSRAVETVIEADPGNVAARRVLVWVRVRHGRYEDAIQHLLALIIVLPASMVERREMLRVGLLAPASLYGEVLELGRMGLTTELSKRSYAFKISRSLGAPEMTQHADELRAALEAEGAALRAQIAADDPDGRSELARLLHLMDGARRIALVGNGPSLRGARRGQEIERYDLIVRCNFPVIKEFSLDVGSRTDLMFFTEALLRLLDRYLDRDPSYRSVRLMTVANPAAAAGFDPHAIAANAGLSLARLPASVLDTLKDLSYRHLTTGAMAYLLLAALLGKQITLFGFDFYSKGDLHYFPQNTGLWLPHEVQYEKFMFQGVVKRVFGAYNR